MCVAAPGLAWFLLLDLLLIAAYTAFVADGDGVGRPAPGRAGARSWAASGGRWRCRPPSPTSSRTRCCGSAGPALLVRVASTAKWLLLVVALGLALWALLVGTARFLLPWSQPPQFPPDVPDGEVGEPWPCVEGQLVPLPGR